MTIYDEMKAAGLVTGSHESDLYVLDTLEAREILKRRDHSFSGFRNEVDGNRNLDIPFAYQPFWDDKATHFNRES